MSKRSLPHKLVTQETAAERLGLSKKTIRRWIAEGRITGYRVGPRYVRLDLDEVERSMVQRIPPASMGSGPDAAA